MPNPFNSGLDDYMFPTTQPGLAATGMILESANTHGKGHIGPLGVLENAVDDDARIRSRTNAMSAVLSWIEEGDFTYNSLDETIVVVADIDGDYEITEEEEEVYSNAWNEVPDALLSLGADEAKEADAVFTIYKTGSMYSPKSYNFRISSSETGYSEAEVAYSDPKTGTTHKARVKSAKKGDSAKTLTIQKRVENPEQAVALGKSELHDANVKEQTASLEIMGYPLLAAGQTIELADFGSFSGKYFIKSTTHKISGSSAYSTSLELTTPAPTEAENAGDEVSEAAEAAKKEVKFAPFLEANRILDGLAKLGFEELLERLPDDIGSKFELILCLPDILDNEIRILEEKLKENPPDEERKKIEEKIGGLKILKQSFIRWLGFSGIVKPENNPDVLWVDWNWLLSEEKAKTAYEDLKANLMNEAAKGALNKKLKDRGYFTQSDRGFSFISEFPLAWRDNHHQSRSVESTLDELVQMKNGHTAVLGKYNFYGMVDGRIEYKGDNTYGLYITKAIIVMLDSFDFEGEQPLGFWNC